MARRLEILTTLLIIALGGAGYLEAQKIAGFSFDPLGSRAFPVGISLLLIGVCGLVLLLPLFRRRKVAADNQQFPATDFLRVLVMLGLVTLYVIAVFKFRMPLSLMTLCFVLLAATTLPMENRKRGSLIALGVGLIIGFGAEWVFTRFFFVDLPTVW